MEIFIQLIWLRAELDLLFRMLILGQSVCRTEVYEDKHCSAWLIGENNSVKSVNMLLLYQIIFFVNPILKGLFHIIKQIIWGNFLRSPEKTQI
jgi:hypothetical protein